MIDTPDFRTFKGIRERLEGRPGLLDLSRTDMADVLRPLLPAVSEGALPERAHRCHLAEDWLALFGLPSGLRREALVCTGVRQALSILFGLMAAKGERVAIPSDVYPVYGKLAAVAGVSATTYGTYPENDLSTVAGCDAILVCNPTKPRGSALSEREVDDLVRWLDGGPRRRVIVDAVYTFGKRLDAGTMRLVETGRAWVLHSLSKGWARPLVMGVALAPGADLDDVVLAAFRSAPPDPEKLREAHALLRDRGGLRPRIRGFLAEAQTALEANLRSRDVKLVEVADPVARYLFLVEGGWQALLERSNVLAIPPSVFGRDLPGISIVSSLGHLLPTRAS